MPSEFTENVQFERNMGPASICLSTYQIQLNMVYQITSPVLEIIQGTRETSSTGNRSDLESLANKIEQSLERWRRELPARLNFDKINDLSRESTMEEKMHKLQALALKMTHDNLVIIVNRPLLADRRGRSHSRDSNNNETQELQSKRKVENAAFNRCLQAALSISNVMSKSRLIHLAQKTHLISFLGINLFTATVVMFICALSDVLSNASQEAKRGMARTLRLQKALSHRASLSMQCSMISEDLIQQVLEREREELLQSSKSYRADINRPSLQTVDSSISLGQSVGDPFFDSYSPTLTANNNGVGLEDVHLRESLLSLQRGISSDCHMKVYLLILSLQSLLR